MRALPWAAGGWALLLLAVSGIKFARSVGVATVSTGAGLAGAAIVGGEVCGAGAVTGPGDLVICPVGVVAGAVGGSALVDYFDSLF